MIDRIGRIAFLNALVEFKSARISSIELTNIAYNYTEVNDIGLKGLAWEIVWECGEDDYLARGIDCPMMKRAMDFLESEEIEWHGWTGE